jgi:RNA polymerase-binding transcription factor DksA
MAKATKQKKSGAKSNLKKNPKVVKPKAVNALKKKKDSMAKKSDLNKKKVKTKTRVAKASAPKKTMVKVSAPRKHAKVALKAEAAPEVKTKTIESIKGYSKKDLEHFRQIILDKRDEILEQLQNLKDQMLDPTTGEYINENSPYSLHMAEQGTDAMEREKTFLYAQRENKFLGYLEDALKRIDAGTYGICIECIEEPQHLCETCPLVPKARLEAVPHSQLCLPIKQRQEKK